MNDIKKKQQEVNDKFAEAGCNLRIELKQSRSKKHPRVEQGYFIFKGEFTSDNYEVWYPLSNAEFSKRISKFPELCD